MVFLDQIQDGGLAAILNAKIDSWEDISSYGLDKDALFNFKFAYQRNIKGCKHAILCFEIKFKMADWQPY